ncbi:MAG: hypothetical protein J07HR59_00744 [Halorubrum sp. J07HR59]|nr:MAG: hypothetical protein J07HR59_00744 [Halorubrum sp. J07HR59]
MCNSAERGSRDGLNELEISISPFGHRDRAMSEPFCDVVNLGPVLRPEHPPDDTMPEGMTCHVARVASTVLSARGGPPPIGEPFYDIIDTLPSKPSVLPAGE